MAVKTKFSITHTCGHARTRDLSSIPAGKRKSRAKWYGENQTCPDCFKAEKQQQQATDSNQRALDAQEHAEHHSLPELEGTEKQVYWASVVRHEAVSEAVEHADPAQQQEILDAARQITWAGWWMDNLSWSEREEQNMDAHDFAELILTGPAAQAERDQTHVESENPF